MTILGKVARVPITSREQWLDLRKPYLGCSDLPNWCGCGYRSALDLYSEKKGLIAPQSDNAQLRKGRWFEPAVGEALAEYRPTWEIRRSKVFLYSAAARFSCTTDMLAVSPDRPGIGVIQCKVIGKPSFGKWLSEGDEIAAPIGYRLQTAGERMLVEQAFGEVAWAVLAVLVHDAYSADLHIIDIPQNDLTDKYILEMVANFWHHFDNDLEPHVDPNRDAGTIAKLFPQDDGSEIDLTGDNAILGCVDRYKSWSTAESEAKREKEVLGTEIRAKMREAKSAKLADGRRLRLSTVNCKERIQKAYTYRRLDVLT